MLCIEELYKNEICIDLYWRKKLKLAEKRINFRPVKYKRLNTSLVLYYFLAVFWLPILYASNIYFFLSSLKIKKRDINDLKNQKIWLDSSIKSVYIKEKQNVENILSIDIRKKEYISYLTNYERFLILLEVLKYLCFDSQFFSLRNKLQLLDLYNVCSFYKFILKIDLVTKELHICNHYDRWAMSCYHAYKKGVELWQHGLLGDAFLLPTKLPNISTIHCLNSADINWWKKNIVGIKEQFVIQKNTFTLTAYKKYIHILIVSNPSYIDEEIELLTYLLEHIHLKSLNIAYKPHPIFNDKKKLKKIEKDILILDSADYPRADLVIHKYSTLGYEYESIGIKTYDSIGKKNIEILNDIVIS